MKLKIGTFTLLFCAIVCIALPYSQDSYAAKKPKVRVTLSPHFDSNVFDRLAVYVEDRSGRRLNNGVIRAIDDEFVRAAIQYGYKVATRSDIDAIERELMIQSSDFTEAAMAKRARALNVPAIILVSVNSLEIVQFTSLVSVLIKSQRNKRAYNANVSVSARMIDAEAAQIIWLSSYTSQEYIGERKDYKIAAEAVVPVASEVAASLPKRQ